MAKRKSGFLQINDADISAYSVTASFNSDSVTGISGSIIFNAWQFAVNSNIATDAVLVLTPECSFDGVTFFPITDAGSLTLNSTTPDGVISFENIFPHARLAVVKRGDENPSITAHYACSASPVVQPKAVSAGALSATTGTFSSNVAIAGTLAVTGVQTLTGNTTFGGTITGGASSDIAINTNKFKVTASNGNTVIAGTLTQTGNITLAGAFINTPSVREGGGAVPVTSSVCRLTSTGTGDALTLADGVAGQRLTIIHEVAGGSAVLTPTTKTGFTTITFTNAGDSATLVFLDTRGWMIESLHGATSA
jgi:hypothetical protein